MAALWEAGSGKLREVRVVGLLLEDGMERLLDRVHRGSGQILSGDLRGLRLWE